MLRRIEHGRSCRNGRVETSPELLRVKYVGRPQLEEHPVIIAKNYDLEPINCPLRRANCYSMCLSSRKFTCTEGGTASSEEGVQNRSSVAMTAGRSVSLLHRCTRNAKAKFIAAYDSAEIKGSSPIPVASATTAAPTYSIRFSCTIMSRSSYVRTRPG